MIAQTPTLNQTLTHYKKFITTLTQIEKGSIKLKFTNYFDPRYKTLCETSIKIYKNKFSSIDNKMFIRMLIFLEDRFSTGLSLITPTSKPTKFGMKRLRTDIKSVKPAIIITYNY